MANVKANRLANFELLIKEAGSIIELSRRAGYNKPAYLYQVHAQREKANGTTMQIGKRVAQRLEEAMGKPAGWMDQDHSAAAGGRRKTRAAKPAAVAVEAGAAASLGVETVTLAFTGASGMPYGIRLLECLLQAGKTVYLVDSQAAQMVAQQEMDFDLPSSPAEAQKLLCKHFNVAPEQLQVFGKYEWFAPIASGNSVADAMVVCPASMGTVAAIACGTADTLLERAADVCIKEKRPLVLVPREAPFSALHLENLLKLANYGCTVLPPSPGFYTKPQSVEDMVDFVVGRILDQLLIPHNLTPKWGA